MERNDRIKQLKEKGLSYQAIGKIFGISRARVHQIISKYHSKNNRKKWLNELFNKIFERDNNECQICGKKGKLIHHINKIWKDNNFNNLVCLCNKCHLDLHRPKSGSNSVRKKDPKNWKEIICLNCGKKVKVKISQIKIGKAKFCSLKCSHQGYKR